MSKFKLGDSLVVTNILEWHEISRHDDTWPQVGEVITVREITQYRDMDIYWFHGKYGGRYEQELEFSFLKDSPLLKALK